MSKTMARLAFLTTHLSGTGHLVRTALLARAAQQAGHAVALITGGRVLDHVGGGDVPLHQLPPVMAQDFDYKTLRQPDGRIADRDVFAKRRAMIARIFQDFRPDVLISELYPFGRRVLADEFQHAIGLARQCNSKVLVLCSVRDIPEPKPKRLDEVAAILRRDFDGVLIHGEAGRIPLAASWPLPPDLMPRLHYTGYVAPVVDFPDPPAGRNILVAAGGGVMGAAMLEIAARAAAGAPVPWHILVGGNDAISRIEILRRLAPDALIEPVRTDYRPLLARAACSISTCGYNTMLDLAACRTPALLIPAEDNGDREQLIRARHFAMADGIEMVRLNGLDPSELQARALRLAAAPRRGRLPIARDGAQRTIAVIETLLGKRAVS